MELEELNKNLIELDIKILSIRNRISNINSNWVKTRTLMAENSSSQNYDRKLKQEQIILLAKFKEEKHNLNAELHPLLTLRGKFSILQNEADAQHRKLEKERKKKQEREKRDESNFVTLKMYLKNRFGDEEFYRMLRESNLMGQ